MTLSAAHLSGRQIGKLEERNFQMTVTKSTDEARQGRSALKVRNVLLTSMVLAIIAALSLFLFF